MSSESETLKNRINQLKNSGLDELFFQKIEAEVIATMNLPHKPEAGENNFVFLPLSGGNPMTSKLDKPTPFNTVKMLISNEERKEGSDSMGSSLLDNLLPKPGIREQFQDYFKQIKSQEQIAMQEVFALNAQLDGIQQRSKDTMQNQMEQDLAIWKKKKKLKEQKTIFGVPFSMNSKRNTERQGLRI